MAFDGEGNGFEVAAGDDVRRVGPECLGVEMDSNLPLSESELTFGSRVEIKPRTTLARLFSAKARGAHL